MDSTKFCVEHDTFPPDEIAYRFHHKLVWIHLFPNGNGRHSRLMTDIILEEVLGVNFFFLGSDFVQCIRHKESIDYVTEVS